MNNTTQSIPTTTNVIEYLLLFDGETFYTVSKAFYDAVRVQVEEIIPATIRGVKYTLEDLCGDEFWHQLGAGEQRMAGRCMADMVCRGLLPLSPAKGKHEYPKLYWLK